MRSTSAPQGTPSRRSFIETARREQIIESAIETIAELGYAQASLTQIAQRIEVSKGVISYYFDGKEALERAIITDVLAKAVAYMQPKVSAESTGRGMLRAAIMSNLAFMGENRSAMVAFFEVARSKRRASSAPTSTQR
jgi:TetR/AcrR family fatty acid metabolism transcriptional regulator